MTAGSATSAAVWDRLVGQAAVITQLQRAVAGDLRGPRANPSEAGSRGVGMTHAWLFCGPPGSGRSNAALAFATALQCEFGGCGECASCHQATIGAHPDIVLTRTEKLSIGVDEVRDLVRRSALAPAGRRWQIMVIEDADRLTDQAGNALLKAIEEPNPRTVWLLCAPTVEDVLPTIRSRTRLIVLSTPAVPDVVDFLVKDGADPTVADYAARVSQGHIGRARGLARDADSRARRNEVVAIPARLKNLGACMNAANELNEVAKREADAQSAIVDERERADLDRAYGVVERGRRPKEYAPALRDLEKSQKTRAKRRLLDVVDRSLMDLVSVYRDALALQLRTGSAIVNTELKDELTVLGAQPPETNVRRIDAVFAAREQMLEFNVPVLLVLESLMIALQLGE